MSTFTTYFVIVLHAFAVGGLALYGAHRIWLLFQWYRKRTQVPFPSGQLVSNKAAPKVTIQLPLYNERFVAARLIAAAAALDWPEDRFDIQVLDDSTDDTRQVVDCEVSKCQAAGITIHVVRRPHRLGFKAGALAQGLKAASGEYVAIFDADFIPPSDFLRRTLPHFSDPTVGMVQARWGFLNTGQSWLTRMQSILINPHFGIEHLVRFTNGHFFNFNGTAGVWRKSTIEGAGGWRADTVTEDLDLSYRAQMKGWRFVYLNDVVVPSEIPSTLSAFRTQQQRWAKGSIQTARMILPPLLRSAQPFRIKMEACAHLLANLGWLFGATAAILLYPAILCRPDIGPFQLLRFDIPLMVFTIGAVLLFFCCYGISQADYRMLFWLPLVPVFSIGIAPALALAVVSGMFATGGNFERTPKFGHTDEAKCSVSSISYHKRTVLYLLLNVGLTLYALLPLQFAWQQKTWAAVPFLLIFPAGYLLVAALEFRGFLEGRRLSSPAPWHQNSNKLR